MLSIKGHFDGTTIVLDEPAMLAVGQNVRVIVEPLPISPAEAIRGSWKDKLKILDESDDVIQEHFKDYLP